ncbi:MAG: DUF3109 family protein [Bacteroidales bacterium]|nr:DUF3109 family protein [Bacteroidales bacterium]
MIQIDDAIVSLDIIEKEFLCDIAQCKGQCCVDGDSGAPLEPEEAEKIKAILPVIWNDLPTQSKEVIERQGVCYTDEDGDLVTSIVGKKECVFAYFDNGVCKCAIEKAYREGKTDFYKPISCHLYPIRIDKFPTFEAVNYHQWNVCQCAKALGKANGVKIYQFLKEPLTRKYGEEWYNELCLVAEEWNKQHEK